MTLTGTKRDDPRPLDVVTGNRFSLSSVLMSLQAPRYPDNVEDKEQPWADLKTYRMSHGIATAMKWCEAAA